MKDYLIKKWRIILFFICIVGIFIFIIAHNNRGYDDSFESGLSTDISQGWSYQFNTGESGTTALPGNLPKTNGNELTLTNTLPTIPGNFELYYKVRHLAIQVYVGDELRVDTVSRHNFGKNKGEIIGIYYEKIRISPDDSGKTIKIICRGNAKKYMSTPGGIILSEGGNLFLDLIRDRWKTLLCVAMLGFLSFVLFILWLMAKFVLRTECDEILCLCLFSASVTAWLLTESGCLQFVFTDTARFTILAYEILMVMPIPIALFFSFYSDREKGRIASNVAATIPFAVFIINNVLHFLHIVHLADSLIVSQAILGFEIVFVAIIQITEIRYKYIQKEKYSPVLWTIPLIGILILVPLAGIEVIKYAFFSTLMSNDGILISVGVLFYLVALAVDSFVRMSVRTKRFQQQSEEKTQFLANMSHEIRTPLNAILGFNEMILRNAEDDKIKKYSTDIRDAGNNLKSIINSILDISKIESGKLEIYEVEYNTVQMLDRLVGMFEPMAKKKGLNLIVDIDPTLPETLIGDENHISQVLTNIISNAVKYTESGTVTFSLKVLDKPADSPICKLYISVEDTGIGIKKEDMSRLFEKFERLDKEKNFSIEGTGLGMSIVIYLLNAMGSQIHVSSEYGQGSIFYFELVQNVVSDTEIGSFEERRNSVSAEDELHASYIAPEASILIVDDVQMNLEAASALLEDLQVKTDTASSGMEAIEKIKANRYTIVLMDHMMPQMDGIQATEAIRNIAVEENDVYFALLPIIALTANAMTGMKEQFLRSGMQDFISKPIEIEQLYSVIKHWLPADLVKPYEKKEEAKVPTVESRVEKPASAKSGEWDSLPECIDIKTCKQFCPKFSLFEMLAKTFITNADANCENMRNLRDAKDAANYGIVVHGLKSSSKTIGMVTLSEMALGQELDCKEGDPENAFLHTEDLIELYQRNANILREYLGMEIKAEAESESTGMSEAEYDELITRVKDAASRFDMGAFIGLEMEMADMVPPASKKEEFERLRMLVTNASFGDVTEMLG